MSRERGPAIGDAAVRGKVDRFVSDHLGPYSSHPRFARRRIRAWFAIAAIPLNTLIVALLWKFFSTDLIQHFLDGTLKAAALRWVLYLATATWLLFGFGMTVLLCMYMSRFEGASARSQQVTPRFLLVLLAGLAASLLPLLVYSTVSDWIESIFGSGDGALGLQYKVYSAALSLLPVLLLIMLLEVFGVRRSGGGGRRKIRALKQSLGWLLGLSGALVFIPSIGEWLVQHSPQGVIELLPKPSEVMPGLADSELVQSLDELTADQRAKIASLLDFRRVLLQVLVFGVFILFVIASVIIVRYLANDEEEEVEVPTETERRIWARSYTQGPPVPLALKGHTPQPRGLARAVNQETRSLVAPETEDSEVDESVADRAGESAPEASASGASGGNAPSPADGERRAMPGTQDAAAEAGRKHCRREIPRALVAVVAALHPDSIAEVDGEGGEVDAAAVDSKQRAAERYVREHADTRRRCGVLSEYAGEEFGAITPSEDQLAALQLFEKSWIDAQRRAAAAQTGSIEHSAEASGADLLIEGDPGTGRTTSLLAMAFNSIALRGQSVILLVPGGLAADVLARRAQELFELSALGPFVTVERLSRHRIEEMARILDLRLQEEGVGSQSPDVRAKVGQVSIPDLAIMTPHEYEEGFFGAAGAVSGIRSLLYRYQVVLIDDVLELDALSRVHLPFILDKHRLVLKLEGYGCQTVVAGRRSSDAARRLLEKRLFTAVGKVPAVRLRPWDAHRTFLMDAAVEDMSERNIEAASRAMLDEGCDVVVYRAGFSEQEVRLEASRLTKQGRGPRVVSSLLSLNGTPAPHEQAREDLPGSRDCPIADPTVWDLAENAEALVMALDRKASARLIVRFGLGGKRRRPTELPLLASSHARSVAWSHLASACRLVRAWAPSNRNYWAKLGLGDALDYSRLGFRRTGEGMETIRRLQVDPAFDDATFQGEQAIWNWIVLEPMTALDGSGGGPTEDLPPQPASFALERLHGFDLLVDPDGVTLQIVRRLVDEPFISTWVTDEGLAAGQLDLAYAPHLRRGAQGVDVAEGGAVFAARVTSARVLASDFAMGTRSTSMASPVPVSRAMIRVECLPFDAPDRSPYIPWWSVSVGFRGRRVPTDKIAPIAVEPVSCVWPEILWVDIRESTAFGSHSRKSAEDGSRYKATLRLERLLSRSGQFNPVSPPVEFEYEAGISVMLVAHPDRGGALLGLTDSLEQDIGELLHGTWEAGFNASPNGASPAQVGAPTSHRPEGHTSAPPAVDIHLRHEWDSGEQGDRRRFEVKWLLDPRIAVERMKRFAWNSFPDPSSLASASAIETERDLELFTERAFTRGVIVRQADDLADGTAGFVLEPDYARLILEGAADLRGLAAAILDEATRLEVRTDRELLGVLIDFVCSLVECEMPEDQAASLADETNRLGVLPPIETIRRRRGTSDSISTLIAALIHACGLCKVVGLVFGGERLGDRGQFRVGLQVPPGVGERALRSEGMEMLPLECTGDSWSIGLSSDEFNGRSFRVIDLGDEDDLSSHAIEAILAHEKADLRPAQSRASRNASPRLTAAAMVALRRHVPDAEKFCRLCAFRLEDPNWMAAILFIEPAPTRRSVSDAMRELLRDADTSAEFFQTMSEAAGCAMDPETFGAGNPSLVAQAEQRVGPRSDSFTIDELVRRLAEVSRFAGSRTSRQA